MKYIKYLSFVLLLSFVITSCEDALDINRNPLAATTADPNVLLPFVMAQYSNRHTTELGTRIMDVPQHFSACFNSARNGNTSIFLTGNTWGMMYSQVLGNLLLVKQDAEEAGPSSNNVAAIAKILEANTYFELTSIWEEVPYSQALNAQEFPEPTFDEQEVVLDGVIDILNDAIDQIDNIPSEGIFDVSTGDIIYGGDMDLWRRYANSLKLRVLMIIRNKKDVSSEIAATLNEPLIESNDQSALIRYSNAPGSFNAYNNLVEAFFGVSNEAQGVYGPGEVIYGLLQGDPRFDMLISNATGEGCPIGRFPFSFACARIKDNVIRNDLPHMLMMPAEINLYKAELAMAAGDVATAESEYKAGVAKNVAWWGGDIPGAQLTIAADVAEAFVAELPTPTMEDIHNQLYIESFIRPVVAWNTVRRTDTPELRPVPGSNITGILKRFNYPPDEVASNPNTPVNLPTDTPMWFEN
ncbi:SusD/RagB family nutrient-binding outer membrane lipoprotein [Portibacter marinus]|uniref:SusD/RagB family nutrient-binding outer membrane lipoprotein n=1 Tax=Portibacter marinus TaxID=2898660 RepID=UPI001F25F77D|nr:SusD/RagB family nutrient-binding outer membrane lipoprotein [Portibacter marinus]